MGLDAEAMARVFSERRLRLGVGAALDKSIEPAESVDAGFSLDSIRRHLRLYCGGEIAKLATFPEILSAVKWHRGFWNRGRFFRVRLVVPSKREIESLIEAWGGGSDDLPLIPRPQYAHSDQEDLFFTPGARYKSHGVHKTIALEPADYADYHDGEIRESRKRRFPAYIERLREYLKTAKIEVEDRQILDLICDGRTIRWIADELDMKRPTVHKRVVKLRRLAGIPGPGPGR